MRMPHGASSYGAKIRKARLKKGWTLQQLAEKTGLSHPFLSRIETGERRELTLSNAAALCVALGLTLEELAGKPRRTTSKTEPKT
ncbi:MAG: helix-turn-helix domain-containing protein [Vulcanimicrobiaceae bacterium]